MEFMINENMFEEEYKKMIRDIMNKILLSDLDEKSRCVMSNLMKEKKLKDWKLEVSCDGKSVIISTQFTESQIKKKIDEININK